MLSQDLSEGFVFLFYDSLAPRPHTMPLPYSAGADYGD